MQQEFTIKTWHTIFIGLRKTTHTNCSQGDLLCLRSGWKWADGSPYTNYQRDNYWESGKPNVTEKPQNCVLQIVHKWKNITRKWIPIDCGDQRPFICERGNKFIFFIFVLCTKCRSCLATIMVITMRTHCYPLDIFYIYIYCSLTH